MATIELFAEGVNTRFFKPMRGCRIYASDKNMTRKAGELIGECIKVDGCTCWFRSGNETDLFLWEFPDGSKNDWFVYSA